MSVFLDLPPLGVCLENATRSGRAVYSVVQINVVKGCVGAVLVHATFDRVYLESRVGLTGCTVCRPSRKDQTGVRQATEVSEWGQREIGFRPNE